MTLWTSEEAVQATGGTLQGAAWSASGFCMDTRSLKAGDVFLALPGAAVDGHNYVANAQKAGAAAAMVSRVPDGWGADEFDLPLLIVPGADGYDDLPDRSAVLIALWKLAKVARARTKAKIIAVTGSVGKTSAKEALALALSAYGSVHATSGNFNNHIGLPLTLAALPREADFAVLEMGMNHANEIAPLSQLARPDVALITTVDAVHIEYFDGIDGIAKAKAEIFSGLGSAGTAVLPADSPQLEILRAEAARYGVTTLGYFGKVECAEFAVADIEISPEGTHFTLKHDGKATPVKLRAVGAHWGAVAAAALRCVAALGLPLEKAIAAIADFQEPVGRGRLQALTINGKNVAVLDDSYNASPVSMRGAIEKLGLLAKQSGRRPVAVLGQMLELGEGAPAAHAGLAPILAQSEVDLVGVCGSLMQSMIDARAASMHGQQTITAADAASLRTRMEEVLEDGDLVLIKGSHGSKVYQIAEAWLQGGAA